MKHNWLITKKPLIATGGTATGDSGSRKEALINFKIEGTNMLLQAIYNKSLF